MQVTGNRALPNHTARQFLLAGGIDACRDLSLHECLVQCLENLRTWSEAVPLDDDISMLAVEIPVS